MRRDSWRLHRVGDGRHGCIAGQALRDHGAMRSNRPTMASFPEAGSFAAIPVGYPGDHVQAKRSAATKTVAGRRSGAGSKASLTPTSGAARTGGSQKSTAATGVKSVPVSAAVKKPPIAQAPKKAPTRRPAASPRTPGV